MKVGVMLEKGGHLFVTYGAEYGAPLFRMIVMSHLLNLNELGIASALMVTYSTFEQVSDIAINRFVYSTPREHLAEALASAHALSVIRGLIIGFLAFLSAPLASHLFGLSGDTVSFQILGAVLFMRSLEHIEPKIREREYHYGLQMKISLLSNGAGLALLTCVALATRNHDAFLASLGAQTITLVVASHLLATERYRLDFFSSFFRAGWRFAYPLVFNGLGLAIAALGDRFFVGAFFGVESLAVYSVSTLAIILPTSFFAKVGNSLCQPALYNAALTRAHLLARLRAIAHIVPMVATGYALAVLAIFNDAIGFIFGKSFMVENTILIILAFTAFFKVSRQEPFTSLLFHEHRTRQMATISLSTFVGLAIGVASSFLFQSLASPLFGRMLGELSALWMSATLTKDSMAQATRDFASSFLVAVAVQLTACVFLLSTVAHNAIMIRIVLFCFLGLFCVAWTASRSVPHFKVGWAARF